MNFPDGGVIRQIAAGKLAMPQDPMLAGAYEVMLERYKTEAGEGAAANEPDPRRDQPTQSECDAGSAAD